MKKIAWDKVTTVTTALALVIYVGTFVLAFTLGAMVGYNKMADKYHHKMMKFEKAQNEMLELQSRMRTNQGYNMQGYQYYR